MMSNDRVVARVKGSSGKNFPSFAAAVISLVEDDRAVTYETGVSMLTDLIIQYAINDPSGWHEPARELAELPIVFDALQWARLRLM